MKKDPVCNMEVDENSAIIAECVGVIYYFCSEGCREKFLKDKTCKVFRTSYDLIIIGGGPAGLTAAVYAATLRMDAFLIAKDLGGQAIDSTKIENYMGYDFITGPELIDRFQDQLIRSHYIDHQMSEVEKIEKVESGFDVTISDLKKYSAKVLIVSTGMTRRKLKVPGEEEFQRRGVFYGNIQDLAFIHGEDVAVIGGGNSALQMVENLHSVAKKIYLISNTKLAADAVIIERISEFKNLEQYEEYKILEFKGDKTLSGVVIRKTASDETLEIPAKGVFIAIGLQPNSSWISHLIDLNERGEIIINPDCSTSCPGIFAAGDVTNAFGKRIVIASGEGAKAALAARQYILRLKEK
ncbi:MAG: FAD-dependent oxidoreductase [Planctomycetota bacterium]|jgi:alkyl hydroperoxide reductase subunit F